MRTNAPGGGQGRPRAVLLALLTLALVAGACGIQQKKADAEKIRESIEKLAAKKTAAVRLAVATKVVKIPRFGTEGGGVNVNGAQLQEGDTLPEQVFPLTADYSKKATQASLQLAPDQPPVPFQIFSRGTLYQRRIGAVPGQGPTQGREWVKFDFGRHYDDRDEKTGQAFNQQALNPAWLIDLLGGALMGSIKRLGTEPVGGVDTMHYKVNFSWDEAIIDDADDDEREAFVTALEMMGTSAERVVKGEVWLDAEGLPRRIKAGVRQTGEPQEDIMVTVEHRYTLELSAFGAPVDVTLPDPNQVSEVESVGAVGAAFIEGIAGSQTP